MHEQTFWTPGNVFAIGVVGTFLFVIFSDKVIDFFTGKWNT